MQLTTLHRRAVEHWAARVAAVTDDQWGDPTPCADWSVRDLVNHVVGEELWTAPLLSGKTIEEVGSQFDGDVLGADPLGTARMTSDAAAAVVDEVVPGGGHVQLSYGEEDMGEYVRQLCADHLIHGWDLAKATGGDTSMDPELVAEVGAWFAEREAMYRGAGSPTRTPLYPVTGPAFDGASPGPTTTDPRGTCAESMSSGSAADSSRRSSPTSRAERPSH